MTRRTTPQPNRETLTRQRVLQAAVELANAGGLGALSMRKLGEAVGVEAMSLYNHVANKEDLLDGMVDLVFGEVALPAPGDDWRQAMRQRAISMRLVLSRHRWAIGLMESRSTPARPLCVTTTPSSAACAGAGSPHPDRPRRLGPRQLHLRVRPAGEGPAVRLPAGDRRTGGVHHERIR
ncbi:TetR family transcriptional regulator [Kitasatospora aburaviensis]